MDISIYNAYIINSQLDQNVKKRGYLEFSFQLCKEIFSIKQNAMNQISTISRIALDHHSDRGPQRRCKACSTSHEPKSTKKICRECQVNLCGESCWVLWHEEIHKKAQ